MAYISYNTYEISDTKNDSFYVDDIIVPIILILNKKGYFTEYCCSGHYYTENDLPIVFLPFFVQNNSTSEDNTVYYKCRVVSISCYVTFKKDIVLPSLPSNFMYSEKSSTIYKNIFLYNDFSKRKFKSKEEIEEEITAENFGLGNETVELSSGNTDENEPNIPEAHENAPTPEAEAVLQQIFDRYRE